METARRMFALRGITVSLNEITETGIGVATVHRSCSGLAVAE
ncbi:hypothetical protein ACFRJ1_02445 [Streptomyces sp. NPDC056773]